ncbi:hypothetical protein B0H14DRAFT_2564621 [Mycena olivaceomarginata]|nr:hypothetical protein B0H14DRAFT_2564621 [Mycena olivaceomarginata]
MSLIINSVIKYLFGFAVLWGDVVLNRQFCGILGVVEELRPNYKIRLSTSLMMPNTNDFVCGPQAAVGESSMGGQSSKLALSTCNLSTIFERNAKVICSNSTVIPSKEKAVNVLSGMLADDCWSGATWFTDGSLLEGRAGGAAVRIERGVLRERILLPFGEGQVVEGEATLAKMGWQNWAPGAKEAHLKQTNQLHRQGGQRRKLEKEKEQERNADRKREVNAERQRRFRAKKKQDKEAEEELSDDDNANVVLMRGADAAAHNRQTNVARAKSSEKKAPNSYQVEVVESAGPGNAVTGGNTIKIDATSPTDSTFTPPVERAVISVGLKLDDSAQETRVVVADISVIPRASDLLKAASERSVRIRGAISRKWLPQNTFVACSHKALPIENPDRNKFGTGFQQIGYYSDIAGDEKMGHGLSDIFVSPAIESED